MVFDTVWSWLQHPEMRKKFWRNVQFSRQEAHSGFYLTVDKALLAAECSVDF